MKFWSRWNVIHQLSQSAVDCPSELFFSLSNNFHRLVWYHLFSNYPILTQSLALPLCLQSLWQCLSVDSSAAATACLLHPDVTAVMWTTHLVQLLHAATVIVRYLTALARVLYERVLLYSRHVYSFLHHKLISWCYNYGWMQYWLHTKV